MASYWGIVNVYLSAVTLARKPRRTLTPGLQADFTPEMALTPSATINGTISLWVDVLAGVASAGVRAIPALYFPCPSTSPRRRWTIEGPNVCFRMQGRVWAEMLWWEASFGPFNLLSLGDCSLMTLSGAVNDAAALDAARARSGDGWLWARPGRVGP